ncbi:hypothetical protein [Amycolatopsis anabasis]|uniref:hypothetical protein n=1 Tax=Amycolatopsis anabasis TaxID=1840409 RepID=UPI001C551108
MAVPKPSTSGTRFHGGSAGRWITSNSTAAKPSRSAIAPAGPVCAESCFPNAWPN